MIPLIIPVEFISRWTRHLTWREARYGLTEKWLGWRSMTELAALHLSGNPDTYRLEDDLAHLGKDDLEGI